MLPPRPLRATALVALALCASCGSLKNDDTTGGRWALALDNDAFTGSDNNYTNGLGFVWSSPERADLDPDSALAGWIDFWDFLPLASDADGQNFASFAIGQQVYTANDIENPTPPPTEQPYAGVLYIDTGLHTLKESVRMDWNLRAGVVGPASGAEQFQREFHRLIGVPTPKGWDTQLPNEGVLNLDGSLGHLLGEVEMGDSGKARYGTIGQASLGNYFTGVGGVLWGELGWNLPEAFGGSGLRGGLASISTVGPLPETAGSLSLFTSLSGYGIAHYLPLDGTVFRDSNSVDTYPFVGAVRGGISMRWQRFILRFHLTHASKSFEGQKEKTDYGTFSFAWIP